MSGIECRSLMRKGGLTMLGARWQPFPIQLLKSDEIVPLALCKRNLRIASVECALKAPENIVRSMCDYVGRELEVYNMAYGVCRHTTTQIVTFLTKIAINQ